MITQEYRNLQDRMAALRAMVVDQVAPQLIQNPQLADALVRYLDSLMESVLAADRQNPKPPIPADGGLAELAGIGDEAAAGLGETRLATGVVPYDETVTSERILAVGDLYYVYQHEKVGVFDVVLKLQELFKAGAVRLSSGDGAFRLYQFDRKQVLRYTRHDRWQAYRRVFGYTKSLPPPGAVPNRDFHNQFVNFLTQVAQFFRDKRISEVIRPRATDPSFGSIAVVRRAGLDLRNNLKHASYGHVNVLRVELLQLLDEAFRILSAPDVRKLFGADNGWDVAEETLARYMGRPHVNASTRSRMAIAGRDVLHWLAQPHILNATRAEFEALLLQIADEAEEWLTSAESVGIVRPRTRDTERSMRQVAPSPLPGTEFEYQLNPN